MKDNNEHSFLYVDPKNILRPEVLKFAYLMEYKLRLHDDRPGWGNDRKEWLLGRLKQETEELELAEPGADTALEAADVANFAMMIAGNNWNNFLDKTIDSMTS